jgi:serine/threonine protein kinase
MGKVAHALKDLYDADLIHRDLKLPNVLLNFPDNKELMPISHDQTLLGQEVPIMQ